MAGRKRNTATPPPVAPSGPVDLNVPPAGSVEVVDTEQAERVIEEATPKVTKKAPKAPRADVPPAKLVTIREEGTGRKRQCAEGDTAYFVERGFRVIG